LLEVPAHDGQATLAALETLPQVREACLVYGADVDALAELEVAAESEVYEALSHLVSRRAVVAAPLVLHVARWVERPGRAPAAGNEASGMEAFVLLKTPAKHVEAVLADLQTIPAIVEASVIYGETDIIARVEVASQDELDGLIFHRLHEMPLVESTRTFIVVRELRWRRD
jgi:DNA-binding Lrp family transcriptional regulator